MHNIEVSIVYATPEKQSLVEKRVPRGTSAAELLELSGLMDEVEALKGCLIEDLQLGIYAKLIAHDHLLEQGDRVEIYRPLAADPKEVRRQLALLGKTMGKRN